MVRKPFDPGNDENQALENKTPNAGLLELVAARTQARFRNGTGITLLS